jgi:hypothetical protein
MLGHAAWQVDVDDRVGDRFEGLHVRHHWSGLEAQHVRQRETTESAEHADVKEVTAADTGTKVKVIALAVRMHFHSLSGGCCYWNREELRGVAGVLADLAKKFSNRVIQPSQLVHLDTQPSLTI